MANKRAPSAIDSERRITKVTLTAVFSMVTARIMPTIPIATTISPMSTSRGAMRKESSPKRPTRTTTHDKPRKRIETKKYRLVVLIVLLLIAAAETMLPLIPTMRTARPITPITAMIAKMAKMAGNKKRKKTDPIIGWFLSNDARMYPGR